MTLAVTCPKCEAPPGSPCTRPGGTKPLQRDHAERRQAASTAQPCPVWVADVPYGGDRPDSIPCPECGGQLIRTPTARYVHGPGQRGLITTLAHPGRRWDHQYVDQIERSTP